MYGDWYDVHGTPSSEFSSRSFCNFVLIEVYEAIRKPNDDFGYSSSGNCKIKSFPEELQFKYCRRGSCLKLGYIFL